MEVNALIFRELLKRGYSLEGNTRVWNIADSKLWYITPEQAQAFLDLEKSRDYQKDVIEKEIDLINNHINAIAKKAGEGSVNIIDLGCGDGKKAVLFINQLRDKVKMRYCPIDISHYMVEKAISRIKKLNVGEVVEFQWNISDFENLGNIAHLLRIGEFSNNFILLLGNTLGNFEINELMYEVRNSMEKGDTLLIGNGLDNRHHDEILKAYNNKFLDDLLFKTLKQIGLKEEDIEYGARFMNSRVEMFYTLQKNIKISQFGKDVHFHVGDQIVVAVSYKYNKNEFSKFMKMYFDDTKVFVSNDSSYALALCKK